MQKEHEQIVALLQEVQTETVGRSSFVSGTLNGCRLVLLQCGIGKVNAAVGAVELIHHFHPDLLINTGVAGGIDARLQVMDVVAGERVAYHDVDCGPESELGQCRDFRSIMRPIADFTKPPCSCKRLPVFMVA